MIRQEKGPLLVFYEGLYVVAVLTAAAVAAAWLVSRQLEPVYRAQARAYLPAGSDTFSLSAEGAVIPTAPRLPTANEAQQASLLGLLRSAEVRTKVAAGLPARDSEWLRKNVHFDIDQFNLLLLTVYDTKALNAAETANRYFAVFREHLTLQTRRRMAEDYRVLEEAIAAQAADLQVAQTELITYMSTRDSVDYNAEFDALNARMSQLRSSIADFEIQDVTLDNRIAEVRRELEARPDWTPGSRVEVRNPRVVELIERLGRLTGELRVMEQFEFTAQSKESQKKKVEIENVSNELATLQDRVESSFTEQIDPIRTDLEKQWLDLRLEKAVLSVELGARQQQLTALLERWRAMPAFKSQLDIRQQDLEKRRETLDLLRSRREELRIQQARPADWLVITEVAQPPAQPFYPKTSLNMAVAGMLGLVAGISLLVVRSRIRTAREDYLW